MKDLYTENFKTWKKKLKTPEDRNTFHTPALAELKLQKHGRQDGSKGESACHTN